MLEGPSIAVLGAGGWGRNHVRTWHQLGALALVCDPDVRRLEEVKRDFPGVAVSEDPKTAFVAPDVRGVVLATPAITHADLALDAVEAGKDVLVEKPLATDAESAARVVDAAAHAGAVLMVGHVLEYHPAVRRLHELILAGELGELRWAASNRLNLGRVRTVENVLWSYAPHDIALLLRLFGEDLVSVSCRGASFLTPGVDDVMFLGMTFPGGRESEVSVSWLHPFKEQRLVVVGERAMAVFDDTAPIDRKLTIRRYEVRFGTGVPPETIASEPDCIAVEDTPPLLAECRHFLDRIVDRGRPLTSGQDGLRVIQVLEAGRRSRELGGVPVPIAEAPLPRTAPDWYAHPSATVDPGARIGTGTKIWHYCHVMPRAVIGSGCSLGQNVFVADNVRIGDGVKIQNNVSVYEGVTLEDGVFCGPSMVFTNVAAPRSDVNRTGEYEVTLVRRGASLGANCTIVCGTTIGEYAFVGAGSVVTDDVPAHALVFGNPARQRGWMCRCGGRIASEGESPCPRCGTIWLATAERLTELAT